MLSGKRQHPAGAAARRGRHSCGEAAAARRGAGAAALLCKPRRGEEKCLQVIKVQGSPEAPMSPLPAELPWMAAAKGNAGDMRTTRAGAGECPVLVLRLLRAGVCRGRGGRGIKCRAEQKAGHSSKQRNNPEEANPSFVLPSLKPPDGRLPAACTTPATARSPSLENTDGAKAACLVCQFLPLLSDACVPYSKAKVRRMLQRRPQSSGEPRAVLLAEGEHCQWARTGRDSAAQPPRQSRLEGQVCTAQTPSCTACAAPGTAVLRPNPPREEDSEYLNTQRGSGQRSSLAPSHVS